MADDTKQATASVLQSGGPQIIVQGRDGLIADVAEKAMGLPPIKAIILSCLTAFLMIVGTACYVVWDSRAKLIDLLAKTTAERVEDERTKTHATALNDFVVRERQYAALLASTRKDLSGSRVLIFQYHNGTESLSGIPFLFQSAVAENAAQGISHEMEYLKRLPLEISSGFVQAFLKGQCMRVAVEDAPTTLAQLMRNIGTEVTYACPVMIDSKKEPTGAISISYQKGWPPPDTEVIFTRLRATASAVGVIQSAYADSITKK